MSDGPCRSLPMSRLWKTAAKFACVVSFTSREIADALERAVERDCQAELSGSFIGRLRATVIGPGEPDLFHGLPVAGLDMIHRHCASPMEASFARNATDASQDGYRGIQALQEAAERTVADRLLAGFRQVEEHIQRETSDGSARRVRERLEGAHGEVDLMGIAQRLLKAPDAPARVPTVTYSGLDDGVPL